MMPYAQKVRLFLFVIAIALVYHWAFHEAWAWWKNRRSGPTATRRQKWQRRIAFSLALSGVLAFAYACFVEPYWPKVTHVTLSSSKLQPGSRFRLVHISDLHSDLKVRLEERLPDLIAREKPDFVVFTGDALNEPAGAPIAQRMFTRIASGAPLYAVDGNWESAHGVTPTLFSAPGARHLDDERIEIKVHENCITLAATAPYYFPEKLFAALPQNEFTILLQHTPDLVEDVAATGRVDLYLAGHTHGGQVALPFYGALMTLSKFDKKYEAGLYRVQNTWLYVTRGIGMEGGPMPRLRFWVRPEIVVIDVVAQT